MKTTFLVTVAALGLCCAALGQQPVLLGESTTVNAVATKSLTSTLVPFRLLYSKDFAFGFTFTLSNSVGVNSNITATVQTSPDGTNFVDYATLAAVSTGTALAVGFTNWTIGDRQWFRVSQVVNANTQGVATLHFFKAPEKR